MTRFAYSRPDVSGVDAAVSGVLEFALVNREEVDGRFRVEQSFKVHLVATEISDGVWAGVADVELPATSPTQGVRVVEKLTPSTGSRKYTVIVPDPAPDVATDLVEVDPATLIASTATVPAWQAITDTVAGYLNRSTSAAADADVARVAAGEFAQASAVSAADADGSASTAGTSAFNAGASAATALGHANDAAQAASNAAGSADTASDAAATAVAQLGLGLVKASNLTDVPDKAAARTALGVPSATEVAATYGALPTTGAAADKQDPYYNNATGKFAYLDPADFDPRRYGAKFDNTTDDYDAIVACITAAGSYARTSGAARVLLPAGTAYLGKAGGRGIPLPYNSPGLVIEGLGDRVSGFRLSKEVVRLFDLAVQGQTYKNLTLRKFFVDAANIGRSDIGPATTATAVTLTNNTQTTVTVASTAGWATTGRCFFPTTDTGTVAGKAMQFTVLSSTTIGVSNYTGGDLTIASGDTIQGAIDDHVIVGTRTSGNDAGLAANGIQVTDLTVEDVRTLNVPTIIGASISAPGTGHARWNICIAPTSSGTPAQPPQLLRINVRRVTMNGGEAGVYIGSFGSTPQPWSAYLDQVYIEDCWHSTGVLPTANYFGLNYEIGGAAYGNRAAVRRCYGWGSGDVGVEINSILDASVEDCVMEEFAGGAYFHTNYGHPTSSTSGPVTTTLSGALTSGATSGTLTAIPAGSPGVGYARIDTEVVQYIVTGTNTVTLQRGFNGSTAAAHSSGAVVTFHEVHRQTVKFLRCKARLRSYALSSGLWMPKAVYTLNPSSNLPHGNIVVRDLDWDNGLQYIGSRFSGGECISISGWTPSIDLNGVTMQRHGINYTGTDSRLSSLISVDNPGGTTAPQTTLRFDGIRARISGSLQSSTGSPSLATIAFESGFYVIDWGHVDVEYNGVRNSSPGSLRGVEFQAGAGASRIRGTIDKFRFGVHNSGDGAPQAMHMPSSGLGVDFLDIVDLDLTDLEFSTNTGNTNYQAMNLSSAFAPKVSVQNWRHPITVTTYSYAQRTSRRRTVATGFYAAVLTDEYIACQLAAASSIFLPLANATGAALPNPAIGREILVKDENGTAASRTITIVPSGTETIDGSTSGVTITTAYGSRRFMAVGGGWITV